MGFNIGKCAYISRKIKKEVKLCGRHDLRVKTGSILLFLGHKRNSRKLRSIRKKPDLNFGSVVM